MSSLSTGARLPLGRRSRNRYWRTVTAYREKLALVTSPHRWLALAGFAVVWLWAVFGLGDYDLSLACLVGIGMLGAISQNVLIGYAGQISLGMAGFLAAGAFTLAIMVRELGITSPLLTLPAAAVVGGLLGVIVGLPSLRVKGLYLAVSTLALFFVISYATGQYQHDATGGAGVLIQDPVLFGWEIDSQREWVVALSALVLLFTIASLNLKRSRAGRAWMAIRDRDVAALALGVNLARYKILAFVLSSSAAAVVGAVDSYYSGFVSADKYTFLLTIQYVAMIVIGGLGSTLGALLGAAFVVLLPHGIDAAFDTLGFVSLDDDVLFPIQFALFGVLMIVFLVAEPLGLVGMWQRVKAYFDQWPFRATHRTVVER